MKTPVADANDLHVESLEERRASLQKGVVDFHPLRRKP